MSEKFYVVSKGRKPGLYMSWEGSGGAKGQIDKFPGAIYKGFRCHRDAICWLDRIGNNDQNLRAELGSLSEQNKRKPIGEKRVPKKSSDSGWRKEVLAGKGVIFTDGACIGNPGPGGYGVVIHSGEKRTEHSKGYAKTTNNRMELLACIVGLEVMNRRNEVVIYSDSKYVVDGFSKGWAKKWQKNNWMRGKKPAKNPDLWERLLALCDRRKVEFRWVKGHAGIEENEVCDRLSTEAARQNDLLDDEGFARTDQMSLFDD